MSRSITKPTKSHERPAKTQISLGIRPVWIRVLTFLYADAGRTGVCDFVGFIVLRLNNSFRLVWITCKQAVEICEITLYMYVENVKHDVKFFQL